MITPSPLKNGDTIAIIAPAKAIDRELIENVQELLTKRGFKVVLGKNLFNKNFQFAGSDSERIEDFQWALDNPDVNAIFNARGGYGTIRIINKLDFTKFLDHPKWIIGFSDITVIHSKLLNLGVESIHGMMPLTMARIDDNHEALEMTFNTLSNKALKYNLPPSEINRNGKANAKLIGGNLSILYSLSGTNLCPDYDGNILFLEDVGENHYHIDRMLNTFKQAGYLKNLKGLIIGIFNQMKDNPEDFGMSAYDIIAEKVKDYDYPVIYNFPAGHVKENYPLVMGRETQLNVDNKGVNISQ